MAPMGEQLGHTQMGSIPDDTPWWAWVLVAILVLFVYPMYRVWGNMRSQEVKQQETAARLTRVDHQVSNEHSTNMRDDIDRSVTAAEDAALAATEAMKLAERALVAVQSVQALQRETRKDIGGIREDHRLLTRRLDDVAALDREQLDSLLKYVQSVDQRVQEIEKEE